MPARLNGGPRSITLQRDKDGHREYKVTFRVEVTSPTTEGPAVAIQCPGLPAVGAYYLFRDDIDIWAWCRPEADVKAEKEGEPSRFWDVTQTFSTKPLQRCSDTDAQDPLLEPQKVSGTFTKFQEEAAYDRFGAQLVNSAWEQFRGPQVEFDRNRPQVVIEQNVPLLQLDLCSSMVDTVNGDVLWGFPPRTVKLSNFSWERKYYGRCNVYFTRKFEFEINYDTWDRSLLDEGTKVLKGHWDANGIWVLDNIGGVPPNPFNPSHFIKATDFSASPMRVVLNGGGLPAGVFTNPVYAAKSVTIANGGTGYQGGDTLIITGGTRAAGGKSLSLIIVGVDHPAGEAFGKITAVKIAAKGSYSATPGNPASVLTSSSGNGNGAQFNVEWELKSAGYNDAGSRFVQKYGESDFLTLGIPAIIG